jgi:hypothetical protein
LCGSGITLHINHAEHAGHQRRLMAVNPEQFDAGSAPAYPGYRPGCTPPNGMR